MSGASALIRPLASNAQLAGTSEPQDTASQSVICVGNGTTTLESAQLATWAMTSKQEFVSKKN